MITRWFVCILLFSCCKQGIAQQTYFSVSHSHNSDYGSGSEIVEINGNYYWGTWGKTWSVNDDGDYLGLLKINPQGDILFETILSDTLGGEFRIPSIAAYGDSGIVSLTSYERTENLPYFHWTSDLVLTAFDTLGNTNWEHVYVDSGYSESVYEILRVDDGFLLLVDQGVDFGGSGGA